MRFTPRFVCAFLLFGIASAALPPRALPQGPSDKESSVLTKDARLKQKMSVPVGTMRTTRLFYTVRRATDVRLYTEEGELQNASLIVASNGRDAASLMDAAAALWLTRWEKDPKNQYKMLVSGNEMNIFLPKTEARRKCLEAGRRFLGGLEKLPVGLRERLRAGQRLNPTELPVQMQEEILQMQAAATEDQEQKTGRSLRSFPAGHLGQSQMQLQVKPKARGVNSYFLTLNMPEWGSRGWSFNDYESRKPKIDARSGVDGTVHDARKFRLSANDIEKVPALKNAVTVRVQRATFPQVLRALHDNYGIAFVSTPAQYMTQRASVNIQSLPLGEAMDKLTEIYQNTEWEYRKGGFIVVRGPSNPARGRR